MPLTLSGTNGVSGIDGSASTPSLRGSDTNTGFVFGTDIVQVIEGGTESARFDASGNLLVGVTTANANGGVLQLKSGITFPATQVSASDVNTLDDYEEGTWTPTILFGGAATGNVYSDQVGRYTKCGQAVTCTCYVRISTKGSATGGLQIGGLPFATNSTTNSYSSSAIWSNGVSSLTGSLIGLADPNSARISVYQYSASGSGTGATNTNCNNGTDFSVTFTYITST